MLNRMLLVVGSGSFTPPPEDEDMRLVAAFTRLQNIVQTEDVAINWTHREALNTDYVTWAGSGADPVIVQDGWYWVWVDITTLGTDYSGPNNTDYAVLIARNGVTLADTLIGAFAGRLAGTSADLMHTGSARWFEAGDEVTVYVQNGSGVGLLIESNPTDGPDYTTDTGPGTISPKLMIFHVPGPTYELVAG